MLTFRSWRLDALAVSLFVFTTAVLALMLGSRPGNAEKPVTPILMTAAEPQVAMSAEVIPQQEVSLDSQRKILAIVAGE